MTGDEYKTNMDLITNQARMISMLPIKEMLDDIDRIESIGFLFVSPMQYQSGLDNLKDQKELLYAMREVQIAIKKIKERNS